MIKVIFGLSFALFTFLFVCLFLLVQNLSEEEGSKWRPLQRFRQGDEGRLGEGYGTSKTWGEKNEKSLVLTYFIELPELLLKSLSFSILC